MSTPLVSIGRFARLAGLSAKALRIYDELGLLRPARVDADSGYRQYTLEQVATAQAIRQLRQLEVPLVAIGAMLDAEPAMLHALLRRHQGALKVRTAELQEITRRLQRLVEGKDTLMNGRHTDPVDTATHRRLGVEYFNGTWDLLDRTRTPEDDERMVHMAHASLHHWSYVGTAANAARGEWPCARVYSVLRRAEPALWHAGRALALVDAGGEGFEDWDRASALQGMAHALCVAGRSDEAVVQARACREALSAIADPEDRDLIESQLDELGLDD